MRRTAALLVFVLLLANAPAVSADGGAQDAGTGHCGREASRAATLIYNVYDLQNMSLDLNGSYKLANDIDASATAGWNGGAGFKPVGTNKTEFFKGILDGDGHKISGLFIDCPGTDYVGLFGYAGAASAFWNIGLEDIDVTGGNYSGGLAGYVLSGTVNNSYASGDVDGANRCGGLLGYNSKGTVSNSYYAGNVAGRNDVGGLVGFNGESGYISNSRAGGNVAGTREGAGGLVGYNYGVVEKAHASASVNGNNYTGGLVGLNDGAVSGSHATGNVTGNCEVGGLIGYDLAGTFHDSYATGNVRGKSGVGGLLGYGSYPAVCNVHADGDVTGSTEVGGLVGHGRFGSLSSAYSTGNVTGDYDVGGLAGYYEGNLSNSHYNIDRVLINGKHLVTAGGLFDAQYWDWYSNGLSLDISDYAAVLKPTGGHYDISSVQGLRDLLGFADVPGYSFRLVSGLDLRNDPGLYIPYLAAGFDGNGNCISNLSVNMSFCSMIGMFGLNYHGTINNTGLAGNAVAGYRNVGGLVGYNLGTVNNSFSAMNVSGTGPVGGLVGCNLEIVSRSHAAGNVSGTDAGVGGLVGYSNGFVLDSHSEARVAGTGPVGGLVGLSSCEGAVNKSYATGNVTGSSFVGGLSGHNTGAVNTAYATGSVTGTDKYVGGLVGFNGLYDGVGWMQAPAEAGSSGGLARCPNYQVGTLNNSYATGNVNGNTSVGGLVGYNGYLVSYSHATGNVAGNGNVGGLVGWNHNMRYSAYSNVSFSFATGNVTGECNVSGLVGCNFGMVYDTYATGNVTGERIVGGLVGCNVHGSNVNNSYSTGYVTGTGPVGGLVGNSTGQVINCFWDSETSGQRASSGGTGKTTAQMKTFSTFSGAGWDFSRTWRMIENVTYPLLLWTESISLRADAGPDQTVDEDTLLTFDANGCGENPWIADYRWSFNDKGPVVLHGLRATYRFEDPGSFVVTLDVTDISGNRGADDLTVTVKDITPPRADAGPDLTVDEGTLVTFDGGGSSDNGRIAGYDWTFQDGGPITLHGARPEYLFGAPGIFPVRLNVTDQGGNFGADTLIVTVIERTPPVACAGPDRTIDEGSLLVFDGTGSSDNAGIVDYAWTFTDCAPVTLHGARPSHRFDEPGTFVVTLYVTDAAGNRAADTMTVTVRDITPPVADAGPDQAVDEGGALRFDGSRSSDNVGVENYTWTFTDGAPTALHGARPSYTFDHPGIFVVTLETADAAGNRAADTMTVAVRDLTAPVAEAGRDLTVAEGVPVTFDGSGSADNVGVVNHTWIFDYGDRTVILYGVSASFTFDIPGVYEVTFVATDAAGLWCEDRLALTVRDITPPVAVAGRDLTVRAGSTVAFNGSRSSDNGIIGEYFWNFTYNGKALSIEGKLAYFKFERPGVYEVVLAVVDLAGNRGEDRLVVTVEPAVRTDEGHPGLLWVPALLIAMAVAIAAGYCARKDRRGGKDGP